MHSIKPSIWTCKTSNGWLNLALARKVESVRKGVLITWSNGCTKLFKGQDAGIIQGSMMEAHLKLRKNLENECYGNN